MPRNRVLSFISTWGTGSPVELPPSPTTAQPQGHRQSEKQQSTHAFATPITPSGSTINLESLARASPPITAQHQRSDSRPPSRPLSMLQTYQPPIMDVAQDTLPELMPIFTYLNSHSNKLYQEGYFLKLHDLDTRGRPSPDRTWTECFAQLVGTVLSLWDASALDVAGEDGEVVPTFINLADASIKMIESLPMNDAGGHSLQNVLSVSTAANNRYLFHFNSLNSLTQWTAGIRLAMYEHSTLQEAYTGSLIAGKGKSLNNIKTIMERTRFKYEDWCRVRFGAGTPWRRCWCVISPPDEKEYQKLQKTLKKRPVYDRSPLILKGDMKFYETRKITKKTRPIATISDAYSAYAIYPQSKPLIDQSTLVKVEARITIHSSPESSTEGFVFVMPESHAAVTGFEIMLRFLFPVWDVFNLYGRPNRLIAEVLDTRSLMFAMPRERRYGYLDVLDVASLIHSDGARTWTEREWRKAMKDLTAKRMLAAPSRNGSRNASRRNTMSRTSLPPSRGTMVRIHESESARSQPSSRRTSPVRQPDMHSPRRVDSAPPNVMGHPLPKHRRSVSEANGYKLYQAETPSRLAYGESTDDFSNEPPPPPAHGIPYAGNGYTSSPVRGSFDVGSDNERITPEGELRSPPPMPQVGAAAASAPMVAPVISPPAFQHAPSQRPPNQPYQAPELRRANSQMDAATLKQLADATHAQVPPNIAIAGAAAAAAWRASPDGMRSNGEYDRQWEERGQRGAW